MSEISRDADLLTVLSLLPTMSDHGQDRDGAPISEIVAQSGLAYYRVQLRLAELFALGVVERRFLPQSDQVHWFRVLG